MRKVTHKLAQSRADGPSLMSCSQPSRAMSLQALCRLRHAQAMHARSRTRWCMLGHRSQLDSWPSCHRCPAGVPPSARSSTLSHPPPIVSQSSRCGKIPASAEVMRAGDSFVTRVSDAALMTIRLLRMSVSGSARYSCAPVVAFVKICNRTGQKVHNGGPTAAVMTAVLYGKSLQRRRAYWIIAKNRPPCSSAATVPV